MPSGHSLIIYTIILVSLLGKLLKSLNFLKCRVCHLATKTILNYRVEIARMSLENAKENLKELGKELNLEGLEFDENNTCILGIGEEFSVHLTYEPKTVRLYIYSPLLDGLPTDDKTKLALYERLLEGSMLGGQMSGGGVGVACQEELILMHCTIDMAHALPAELRNFVPRFVESVEKWRKIVTDVIEGRDSSSSKGGAATSTPQASSAQKPATGQGPEAFIRI